MPYSLFFICRDLISLSSGGQVFKHLSMIHGKICLFASLTAFRKVSCLAVVSLPLCCIKPFYINSSGSWMFWDWLCYIVLLNFFPPQTDAHKYLGDLLECSVVVFLPHIQTYVSTCVDFLVSRIFRLRSMSVRTLHSVALTRIFNFSNLPPAFKKKESSL